MIVGEGGGESDIKVDMKIIEEGRKSKNRGVMMKEKM